MMSRVDNHPSGTRHGPLRHAAAGRIRIHTSGGMLDRFVGDGPVMVVAPDGLWIERHPRARVRGYLAKGYKMVGLPEADITVSAPSLSGYPIINLGKVLMVIRPGEFSEVLGVEDTTPSSWARDSSCR